MNARVFLRHLLAVSILFGTLTACTTVEIKEANFFMPRQIMSSGERFEVRSHDGILLVGRLLRSDRPRGTIVFFNGNADLVLLSGKRLSRLADFGFNVIAVDYRGFGESGGTLTLKNLQSDSVAIYQAVTNRDDLGTKRIMAYGWSLGSFAATYMATHEAVDGLVLEGAQTNVQEVLGAWTPWYVKPFVRFNIDPDLAAANNPAELKKYSGPLLIISGQQDNIAPPAFSEHLYTASASSTKRWVNINANHKNIYAGPEFTLAFEAFSTLVFGERQH